MNAVFPGSFDPFTIGHYDMIKRAAKLFEKIFVAVAHDTGKQTAPAAVRVNFAKASLLYIPNVEIVEFDGLTTDFASKNNCGVILRGVRGTDDFLYEQKLYTQYKKLAAEKNIDVEIIYLISQLSHISSSKVRQLVKEGLKPNGYVKENILDEVIKIYGLQ